MWRAVLVGVLGVAGPVLAGLAMGQLRLGLGIGLGAMLLGGESAAAGVLWVLTPGVLAIAAAVIVAGRPWGDPAMIALATLVATVGGYSRPLAVASVRFVIYFVLAVAVLESAPDRTAAALAFAAGALWNMLLRRIIAGRRAAVEAPALPPHARRVVAFRQRLKHWAAWQYTLRLTGGLALASIIRQLWIGHHGAWLLITVALLTGRTFERFPVKITQRAIGVTLGVALTWLILAEAQAPLALGAIILLLAAALPVLRAGNYLYYAAAMTPMIILVLDFGQPRHDALLVDRLVATGIGTAIVLLLNVLVEPLLKRDPARAGPAAKRA